MLSVSQEVLRNFCTAETNFLDIPHGSNAQSGHRTFNAFATGDRIVLQLITQICRSFETDGLKLVQILVYPSTRKIAVLCLIQVMKRTTH